MLSMVRSNLYRMVHSSLFWGYLITYVVLLSLMAFVSWMVASGPLFGLGGGSAGAVGGSSFELYSETFLSGIAIGIFVSALCAVLFVRDFDNGYMKNLLQINGGRVSYAVAASITALVVAVVFVVVGVATVEVAFRIAGFGSLLVLPPLGDLAVWLLQCVLVLMAYTQIVLCVTFFARSSVASIVAVMLVSTGMLEDILRFVFSNVFKNVPALRDCLDGYLSAMMSALAAGPVPGTHLYVVAGVTIIVGLIVGIAVMCRKDVR